MGKRGAGKQKTLFKKYLRITSLIIVVSFFFLGLVMIVFVSQYWQDEKRDLLGKNATSVAQVAGNSVFLSGLPASTVYSLHVDRSKFSLTASNSIVS